MTLKYDEKNLPYIDLENDLSIRLETDENDVSEDFKQKAINELHETPENVQKAWTELKELLEGEKNLSVPIDNPKFFTKYLRCAKYEPKAAFEHIKQFFKFRKQYEHLSENITPDGVKHVYDQEIISLLPLRDKNGRRIILGEFGRNWDPAKCAHLDIFRAMQVTFRATSMEPATQINGVVVIMDMENLSFNQITHMNSSFAAAMSEWMKDCAPVNLEGFYVVNNPYIFSIAFAIMKPFIKDKLKEKIFVIKKDWTTLKSLIGENSLKTCYGGTLDVLNPGKVFSEFLCHYQNEYEELNSYGYNATEEQT